MKKFLTLFIVIFVSMTISTVQAQNNSKAKASVALNVRGSMSTSANVLGTIPQGQIIEILAIEDGWARIDYFGQPGYILTEYILPVTDDSSTVSQPLERGNLNAPINSLTGSNDTTDKDTNPTESFIQGFTNVAATWTCGFNSFDKGYYGLRAESFSESGAMLAMSFKGSWGVTTPGLYEWRVGYGKGWVANEWLAVALPVSFEMGDYVSNVKIKKNGDYDYETDLKYGLIASPGLRFKIGSLIIGAQIDLGVVYAGEFCFSKGLEFSLGFKY